MNKPKILVTGAAGKTGSAAVLQLLEKGYPVRAIVRSADARSAKLAALGAEIVVADVFDFEQLLSAMRGVQRAYYVPPFHPFMIHSAAAFAAAVSEAKLESIVWITQWLANPSHPSIETRHHWLMDRILSMIPDVAKTIVNPGFFADPYMIVLPNAALLGVLPLPLDGESRNAPPSNEDIARVAVGALMDPEQRAGKTYRPTGPVLLSVNEMVTIMSRVLGRTVRHVKMPVAIFLKGARLAGQDDHVLAALAHYAREHNDGVFALGAPTNDVLEVSGRRPEDFETITRRHAAMPLSQRTLSNTLNAFAEFMSVPLRPGLNARRYEIDHDIPMPPVPHYDIQSERWKREHIPASAATDAFLNSVLSDAHPA